jgi:HEPN domain-containing protein
MRYVTEKEEAELEQSLAKLQAAGALRASWSAHELIHDNADAFERVASKIYREGGFDREHGLPSWPPGFHPLVVNGCFAAELYLKAMYSACGTKVPKGHDLKRLFDELPPNAAAAVASARSEVYPGKPAKERSMSEVVRDLKDAFVDFRYAHESRWLRADVAELMHVLRALRRASMALVRSGAV